MNPLLVTGTLSATATYWDSDDGKLVAGIALYDRIDLDSPDGPLSVVGGTRVVRPGPGLYVCIAGGVVAAIGALFAASRR